MGRIKMRNSLSLGLVLISSAAFSQFGGGTSVTQERYRLRVDDIIRVQLYNEIQVNTALPILPDGRISLPFAGTLEAAGKTTTELEAELVAIYKQVFNLKDPKVSVTIERYTPIRARVAGPFLAPAGPEQQFEFRPGDTILSLITRAGGVDNRRGDLRRAYLQRQSIGGLEGSRELIPINLHAMLIKGDMSQNYPIEDRDVLIVPDIQGRFINVQGAVQAPGPFEYIEGMDLFQAISNARGPIPIRAKMSEVIVIRRRLGQPNNLQYFKVNYVRLIKNQDATQNMKLEPGDVIYVTETRTPDLNQLGSIVNTFFIVDRLLRDGVFGFRVFGN